MIGIAVMKDVAKTSWENILDCDLICALFINYLAFLALNLLAISGFCECLIINELNFLEV
jgi:hypothetical protein